ncbi:PREDICTED: uncharacterized protein LOC105111189, partial [Populus euphratica]|uniref:Uncharacterized protein LOC105111189 n=1 Tax=Populus euphratica TaxID=75702 RepID=A0AAJ6X3W1_POPEU
MTCWETVQLRCAIKTLTWSDFKIEFENQFYSNYHSKVKEKEFLAFRQGDVSVLEYERRFHDLPLFAPFYVLTEEHMIKKLRDGLQQDLRQGLIALMFKSVRELIEAAQALEACIGESQGGYQGIGKKEMGTISVATTTPEERKRIGDHKGVDYRFCIKCGQNTLGTAQFPLGDALYAEEKYIPIVKEFPDVFPEELPGLPLEREVE